MAKFELSISPDYVPDWTLEDAFRELFQNAIDQEAQFPDNKMFHDYDYETETYTIGNKKSVLEIKSLLLGVTSKEDDDRTIGKFGEGYKIATLVLLRLGKEVTFYNYGAREVWRPRFVNSRRYGTRILTFFVDKKYVWNSVPDNNLTIEITNINEEEDCRISATNLHIQGNYRHIKGVNGDVLLESDLAGKIFVNGLYVAYKDDYRYGYDFKPSVLGLDRDRKMVNDFDLAWESSRLWGSVEGEQTRILEMVNDNVRDIRYISSHRVVDGLASLATEYFESEHGLNAVPVTSQAEMEEIDDAYKPVIVNGVLKDVLVSDVNYEPPTRIEKPVLSELVGGWLLKWSVEISSEAYDELHDILESGDWE